MGKRAASEEAKVVLASTEAAWKKLEAKVKKMDEQMRNKKRGLVALTPKLSRRGGRRQKR